MSPDEELDQLAQELDRLQSEHPNTRGRLRLSSTALRSCSHWKWGMHGWKISDGQSCGIMNGNEKERRTALLSILKERMIDAVEFVADADVLEVLPVS